MTENTVPDDHVSIFNPTPPPVPLLWRRPDHEPPSASTGKVRTLPAKKVVRVRPSSVPTVSKATKYHAAAPRRALVRRVITMFVLLAGLGGSAAVADHILVAKIAHDGSCVAQHTLCPAPTWFVR